MASLIGGNPSRSADQQEFLNWVRLADAVTELAEG
jgi:hypothetical protein